MKTEITVGQLRKLLENLPEDMRVYLYACEGDHGARVGGFCDQAEIWQIERSTPYLWLSTEGD